MVACILIPGFELRAALRTRIELQLRAAALAPEPGREPLLGPVTAIAENAGVRPGMRLGEALATCPSLVLVDRDPAAVELEWEGLLRRLEDCGFAVEPDEPGTVYFETDGIERLYGGLEPALKRALRALGEAWEARAGAAERRFAALAAASVARGGQALIVSRQAGARVPRTAPADPAPARARAVRELEELGVRKIGQLAGLPGGAVAERLGPDGRRAWSLARGDEDGGVKPRRAVEPLAESLAFPESVGNEFTEVFRQQILHAVDAGCRP